MTDQKTESAEAWRTLHNIVTSREHGGCSPFCAEKAVARGVYDGMVRRAYRSELLATTGPVTMTAEQEQALLDKERGRPQAMEMLRVFDEIFALRERLAASEEARAELNESATRNMQSLVQQIEQERESAKVPLSECYAEADARIVETLGKAMSRG